MKNKVQLIAYIDRLAGQGIPELHKLFNEKLAEIFEGGIHLLPFYYPIDGSDAGYDPIDHTQVDQRLGTWKDIKALGEDVDIMADIIVNHMSADSAEFTDVRKQGKDSKYFDLFLTREKVFHGIPTEQQLSVIYRPRPNQPFTRVNLDGGEEIYFWTTFTKNQIDIDVTHPLGAQYLDSILNKFVENGIKMIRLDAAGYAIKKKDTSCFMIPETFQFIREFSDKAKNQGIEVLVEIHSHYKQQIEIAANVDYIYDFALPPLILHALESRNGSNLVEWLKISPRNCITVLDTHDGIGVIDVAGKNGVPGLLSDDEVDQLVDSIHRNSRETSKKATGAVASNLDVYQVNCTYFSALGSDKTKYLIARAIQFFSPGVPQVYYMGFLAGENDMELLSKTNVGRDINRHFYTTDEIDHQLSTEIVSQLVQLIKFRNTHPAFNGDFEVKITKNKHLFQLKWTLKECWNSLTVDLEKMSFTILEGVKSDSREFKLQTVANG